MVKDKSLCLRDLREHVTTLIGRHLTYWRRFADERLKDIILKRLQSFHCVSFYLELLHFSDLQTNNEREKPLINCLSVLSESWNVDKLILSNTVTKVRNQEPL